MNNGGGNGGGSFKVKHGSYAAEVTNVHEAGAGEVGDVVGEREMRIISFGILGKTCFIASPIFFILAINESFSACLSLSISRSSFLRLSAASRLCLSSLNCSC